MADMPIAHDPQARLDYTWDWSAWLGLTTGDTISTATVTPDTGLTVSSVTVASPLVTAWVSGGTLGGAYAAVCHIVTAQGREDDWTLTFVCQNR